MLFGIHFKVVNVTNLIVIVGYRVQQLTEFADSCDFHRRWWGCVVVQAFYANAFQARCRRIAHGAIIAEAEDDIFAHLTLDPFALLRESDEEQRHS